ncbi:MAG: hypothetical protein WA156_17900, partial [Methylocystis silviterrae]
MPKSESRGPAGFQVKTGFKMSDDVWGKVDRNARLVRFGLFALALFAGALGYGAWKHIEDHRVAALIAERQREFTPIVTVRAVK